MKTVVGVADMRVSTSIGDVIVTHGLGSCLGVTVHDPDAGVGGILHVMLPVSSANPDKAKANPWMFVDTAIPAFFQTLQKAGASPQRWRLTVSGCASRGGNDYFAIGKRNLITLKKLLWKQGVFIDAQDVGGNVARTLYLEIGSGRTWLNANGHQRGL